MPTLTASVDAMAASISSATTNLKEIVANTSILAYYHFNEGLIKIGTIFRATPTPTPGSSGGGGGDIDFSWIKPLIRGAIQIASIVLIIAFLWGLYKQILSIVANPETRGRAVATAGVILIPFIIYFLGRDQMLNQIFKWCNIQDLAGQIIDTTSTTTCTAGTTGC
jgi:hypothetical protein